MGEHEKSGKNDKKIIYFEFLHDRSAKIKLNLIEKNKN